MMDASVVYNTEKEQKRLLLFILDTESIIKTKNTKIFTPKDHFHTNHKNSVMIMLFCYKGCQGIEGKSGRVRRTLIDFSIAR